MKRKAEHALPGYRGGARQLPQRHRTWLTVTSRSETRVTSLELENFLLHRIAPHRSERLPVQRRRTVFQQRGQMLRGAVTLVRSLSK
jgi:hypothetical protein